MGQLDLWPWKLLAVEGRLVGAIRFERTTTCTPSGPDLFLTCATAASWELLNGCNVTLGSMGGMGCVPSYVPGGTVHAPDRLLQVTFRQVPVPPFHHGVIGPTADFAQVEQVPAAHDVVRRERVPQPVKRSLVTLSTFDADDNLLEEITHPDQGMEQFATDPFQGSVSRLEVKSSPAVCVANLRFEETNVPAMSRWGLTGTAVLLLTALTAVAVWRRRSAA